MSFVSKYRPKHLKQMVGQEKITEQLDKFEGKPPHIFMAGPPGSGKTTAAFAIARKALGNNWKRKTLFLNASDERGIDVIRNKVKLFASTKAIDNSFKIIISDESDNMTPDAQKALKTIIEANEKNCTFILTANEPSDVIDPIKDRCNQFYFKRIEDDSVKGIIDIVVKNEKIDISSDLYDLLIKISNGSMRQILYNLENFSKLNRPITKSDFNILPEDKINLLIKYAFSGNENDFYNARKIVIQLIKDGTTVKQINSIIFNRISESKFSEQLKAKLFIYLQQTDRGIATGAVPEVQLIGFLSNVFLLLNKSR